MKTTTDKLVDDPTIAALVDRCGWFDPELQFQLAEIGRAHV